MSTEVINIKKLFLESSLSEFLDETDLFFIDFKSKVAHSCWSLRILGYNDKDLLNVIDRFPAVDENQKGRFLLFMQHLIANGSDHAMDTFHLFSKNQSERRWIRASVRILSRDAENRPEVVIGHVVDVNDLITSQEEIRERLVEINAMRELFTAINKSLDFSLTFQRIVEQLRRIIPFEKASAQSLEGERLVIIASFGFQKNEVNGLVFPADNIENPAVHAIRERRIIICNDVPAQFPGFVNASDEFTTMSWLGIPLIYEEKVIGLLALDNSVPNSYTEQHVRLAGSLAEYIAIALAHALAHQLVTHQALTDRLTGLANRFGLETSGMEIFQKSIDHDDFLGVLMIDIDHFKQINDSYGHPYGDVVLQSIAMTIRDQIRNSDYAVRYGGEEFVVLLPGLSAREALIVAERLRIKISQTKVDKDRKFPTVSVGIYSAMPGPVDILHEYIRKADSALYAAKEAGRNRSRVWSANPENSTNE